MTVRSKAINSDIRYCEQLDISNDVGELLGGAHLIAVVMYTSFNTSPSFLDLLVEIFENPRQNLSTMGVLELP